MLRSIMGCGSSQQAGQDMETVKEIWHKVEHKQGSVSISQEKLVSPHSDWKTVRLFLACTFKDFRNERNLLHTKLLPALQQYCEKNKLIFILEDFYPRHSEATNDPDHAILYLDAIEQCYEDNQCPYFLSLLGECAGYVPPYETLEQETAESYGIHRGMSLLEMAIMTAAFRFDNPNALFMVRDAKFLQSIPFHKVQFIEDEPGRKRISFLKQKLWQKIPVTRFITYHCTPDGVQDTHAQFIRLKHLERFLKQVAEFFKKRIEHQYPLANPGQTNFVTTINTDLHTSCAMKNSGMESRQLGETTQKLLQMLEDGQKSIVLTGDYGCGKTSILSKLAVQLQPKNRGESALKNSRGKEKPYTIFVHFCRNVVGGNATDILLRRILDEVFGVEDAESLDADHLRSSVLARFLNPSAPPTVLIIDDLDKLDEPHPLGWLPEERHDRIKIVFSVSADNLIMKQLRTVSKTPHTEIKLSPLKKEEARELITKYLHHVPRGAIPGIRPTVPKTAPLRPITVNANGDRIPDVNKRRQVCDDLMNAPPPNSIAGGPRTATAKRTVTAGLRKQAAAEDIEAVGGDAVALKNPEFTAPKCMILSTILRFSPKSLDLTRAMVYHCSLECAEIELFQFEADLNGHLLVATLCFLEASKSGLREIELRYLLADEHRLIPESIKRRHSRLGFNHPLEIERDSQVAPVRWRQTLVRLSHHLMDIGRPGENRFHIATSSCRKAVQKRYFSTKENRKWWHSKLAKLFEQNLAILQDRTAEELPHHLIAIGKQEKLIEALSKWEVLDSLFDENGSRELIRIWEDECGGKQKMEKPYENAVFQIIQIGSAKWAPPELIRRTRQIAILFKQAELYNQGSKMIEKSIEMEMGMMKGRPESLADLFSIQGSILHEKIRSKNELLEWVESEEKNQIHSVITAFSNARNNLQNAEKSKQISKLNALCQLRLAFWNLWRVKLTGEDSFKSALDCAGQAKDIYHELKNYTGQADAYKIRAQCESAEEKIQEALNKAEDRVLKAEGPFSAKMLEVYALKIKLLKSSTRQYLEKSKELCQMLYQQQYKEKYSLLLALIHELSV